VSLPGKPASEAREIEEAPAKEGPLPVG